MKTTEELKIKFYYKGVREADGWGRAVVYDGCECPNGIDQEFAGAIARDGFDKMMRDCGEAAVTLVQVGERDYSYAYANERVQARIRQEMSH